MRYGIAILDPRGDGVEGVVGTHDSMELAEEFRKRMQEAAASNDTLEGVRIDPDCIGPVVPIGGLMELALLPERPDWGNVVGGVTHPSKDAT